jgi:hypothetical protein
VVLAVSDDMVSRVIADLRVRREKGIESYGVPLLPFNGRDALQDAYEEALDMCLYIKQMMIERQGEIKMEFVELFRIDPSNTKRLIRVDVPKSDFASLEVNEDMNTRFINESKNFPDNLSEVARFYNLTTKSGLTYIVVGDRNAILEKFSGNGKQILKG